LSYCKFEDGSMRWAWVAPTSGIPLFLTCLLAENPTAKVIVCEGEKAAGAALALMGGPIAVTWYGGAKAVHKAPWGSLSNRDVLVWPDHDAAGSKAGQAVINELRQVGCASIAVIDAAALAAVDPRNPDGPKRQPPPKWDAADAFSEWSGDLGRLAAEVDRATRQLETRVRVEVSPDNIGETVDRAEEVSRNSHLAIFQRAGFIVRAGQYTEKFADGRSQLILSAHELSTAGLGETLERVIQFEQRDARRTGKGAKPVHAPELLLKTFLERGKLSGLKPLTGLTDIPLIRRNGTLLDVPGYDEATGIFYKPSGLALDIPANPTVDDAIEAVETLRKHRQDSVWVFECSSCERTQLIEPLAPVCRLGQGVEQINKRDCVCRERSEVLKRSRQDRRLRFVFLTELRKPQPEIVGKPADSTPPSTAPADHRRVDEEALPTTRRPQLSFPYRSFIGLVLLGLCGSEFFSGFLSRGLSKLGVGRYPTFAAGNRFGRRAI
jgi:hypothetical protein